MGTVAEFLGNPLFSRFTGAKYPAATVGMFLSIAAIELDEHRAFMGAQFNLISFLLSAHRLTKWASAGLLTGPAVASISVLPISEVRQIVSSLSVSDEAGSESITFQQRPASPTVDTSAEDFASTEFGVMYLTLFKKFRCPRSWAVVGGSIGSTYGSDAYYGMSPVIPPVVIPSVGSITGGGEFIARFSYGDSTPKILNIPITGLVDRVLIGIEVPFNVPSTLSIGTTASPSLLMAIGQNAPTEVGQFESNPSVALTSQHVILTITPGAGISQGSGFVIVEYSVP